MRWIKHEGMRENRVQKAKCLKKQGTARRCWLTEVEVEELPEKLCWKCPTLWCLGKAGWSSLGMLGRPAPEPAVLRAGGEPKLLVGGTPAPSSAMKSVFSLLSTRTEVPLHQ